MRGDSHLFGPVITQVSGSPPHAWGQPHRWFFLPRRFRFTPTCVGTASASRAVGATGAVHPHMRGDSLSPFRQNGHAFGSPPHAWGQLVPTHPTTSPDRFTPTCVGTASRRGAVSRRTPVHPHMRGDSIKAEMLDQANSGSPPHAWGQLADDLAAAFLGRFTPTCVGTAEL